jgi:hypothetical protein
LSRIDVFYRYLFLVENANVDGAMKALENLETMLKGKTQARKTELKRQFNNIKMKDGEEVSRFIARTHVYRSCVMNLCQLDTHLVMTMLLMLCLKHYPNGPT